MKTRIQLLLLSIAAIALAHGVSAAEAPLPPLSRVEREVSYQEGLALMQRGEYELAQRFFYEFYANASVAAEVPNSVLLEAYCMYQRTRYSDAIVTIDNFLGFYPTHSSLEYALYLKMLCNYAQTSSIYSSPEGAREAIELCEKLLKEFPGNLYIADVQEKMGQLRTYLVEKNIMTAMYQAEKKNPVASIIALQKALKEPATEDSVLKAEVLFRILYAYHELSILAEGSDYFALLKKQFPSSRWTKAAERLLRCSKIAAR